jgi:hypothetical protein
MNENTIGSVGGGRALEPPPAADARQAPEQSGSGRSRPTTLWPVWVLLVVFSFIALESALLALTLKGRWLILLAPGAVCASKALETWRHLRRAHRKDP